MAGQNQLEKHHGKSLKLCHEKLDEKKSNIRKQGEIII